MPRPIFADPKNGFTFTRIFGSDERKGVLIAFLDDMLALEAARRIVAADFLHRGRRPAVDEMDLSLVDVACRDGRDVRYIVKIQVLQVEGFDRRLVDNVAKAYVSHALEDEVCPERDDVVGITICDFPIWPTTGDQGTSVALDSLTGLAGARDVSTPMWSRWTRPEERPAGEGTGQTRLVFLELPKYDTTRPPQTRVEKWACFFRETDNLTVVPEVLAEPPFLDAIEGARIARFTVDEWDVYIRAGMAIQDKRGALAIAEKRGRKIGEKRGREQDAKEIIDGGLRIAIETACDLLGIDLTDDRRGELAGLDTAGLQALLARLRGRKSWI